MKTQLMDPVRILSQWLLLAVTASFLFFASNAMAMHEPSDSLATPHAYDHPYSRGYDHPHPNLWATPYLSWHAKVTEFRAPMLGNERLDYCLRNDRYCGRSVANMFCQSKGYGMAARFEIDRYVGMTRTIGDNKVCQHQHRDGFRYIRCVE